MNERLAELHERIARRRRRRRAGLAGAAAMAVVVAGLTTVRLGAEEDGSVATLSTRSTSTTSTTTVSVTGLRLPAEGVAVELSGRGVVLVGLDGTVLGELPGFRLSGHMLPGAGPVLLEEGPDHHFHLLDMGRILPRTVVGMDIVVPMPYGNELAITALADPGGSRVRRDGHVVFDLGSTIAGNPAIANDRDLVSSDASEDHVNRVYDLRTGKVSELQSGCEVADRHGPRRYLVCDGTVRAGHESDSSPPVLYGPPAGGGGWRKAMVSPDGKDLLLEWWGDCDVPVVFLGSSTGGRTLPYFDGLSAEALGWAADGQPVVYARASECGNREAAIHVGDRAVYTVPAGVEVTAAAMWAPTIG